MVISFAGFGILVDQDAQGGSFNIVELAAPYGAEERAQKAEGEQEAGADQDKNHAHWVVLPSQEVSPTDSTTTEMELRGMRMAHTRGERRPCAAKPIPTAL